MTDRIKPQGTGGQLRQHRVFRGAGVSTESGIPDFRSTGGLYHQEWKYPPEVILSHTFCESNPEEFFRFYRAKLLAPDASPTPPIKSLASGSGRGKLKAVITRTSTGSTRPRAAGTCWSSTAASTGTTASGAEILRSDDILHTEVPPVPGGGIIKPDVVLYEEGLNQGTLDESVRLTRRRTCSSSAAPP